MSGMGKVKYYRRKAEATHKKKNKVSSNLNFDNSRFNSSGRTRLKTLRRRPIPITKILKIANQEIRSVIARALGEEFLNEINARILHRDGPSMLFEVRVRQDWHSRGVIKYVRVKDPTSGSYYYLRVPPTINTCKEAISWTFGMTEAEYNPITEA